MTTSCIKSQYFHELTLSFAVFSEMPSIKQEMVDEDGDEGEDGEKSSDVPASAADNSAMQWALNPTPGSQKVTNSIS